MSKSSGTNEEVPSEVAAEILGISLPHLDELLDAKAIPYRSVGGGRRIRVSDLESFRTRKKERAGGMAKIADIVNESEAGWG